MGKSTYAMWVVANVHVGTMGGGGTIFASFVLKF